MDISEIDVHQLEARLAAGAALFDVREADEYTTVRIDGARLVPLATVPDHLDAFRGAEGPVHVICAKGGRSARAVEFLRDRGVDAVNVDGGMQAWVDAAKPARHGSS